MGRIFDEALAFLTEDGWYFVVDEAETALKTSFSGKNGEFSCLARALEDRHQFVFTSDLPVMVPEAQRAELAAFITRANYGMLMGAFELNLDSGEVHFRTGVDMEDVPPTAALIRNVIYVNVLTMDKYFPGLMRVIYGGIPAAQAILEIEG